MTRFFLVLSFIVPFFLFAYFDFRISYVDVLANRDFKRGFFFFNRGFYQASINFFKKAVEKKGDFFLARYFLAKSLYYTGYKDLAIWEFRRLIKDKIGNVSFLKNKLSFILNEEIFGILSSKHPKNIDYVFYKVVEGKESGRFKLTGPYRIAITDDGYKYITGMSSSTILVLDYNDKLYDYFYYTNGFIDKPTGIFAKDKYVVYSDAGKDRICLYNRVKRVWKCFGKRGEKEGDFFLPRDVAIDKDDNIWVVDTGNYRIQKFSLDGRFIFSFGKRGEGKYSFLHPISIAVAMDNTIYILDDEQYKIFHYDTYGSYLGEIDVSNFKSPVNIRWMSDYDALVLIDGKEGPFIYKKEKKSFEKLVIPDREKIYSYSDIAVDRFGFLYVLDYATNGIFLFADKRFIYSNMDVDIVRVDWFSYPTIAVYFKVRDRQNRYITVFDNSNVVLYDNGVPMSGVNILARGGFSQRRIVLLVNRNSYLCKKRVGFIPSHKDDIKNVLKKLFSSLTEGDKVKVVALDDDISPILDYDEGRLRIISKIMNLSCNKMDNVVLSKGLYYAIEELLKTYKRAAILLITDDKISVGSYDIDEERIMEMMALHKIPIFILSFARDNEVLKNIANISGGYYAYIYNQKAVNSLISRLLDVKRKENLIIYRAQLYPPNIRWHTVKLKFIFKDNIGIDISGYYAENISIKK